VRRISLRKRVFEKEIRVRREEEIVREVLAAWQGGLEATKESWARHCASQMVWWNSGRGAIEGLDACLQAIDAIDEILHGFSHIDVPVRRLMAEPEAVMVERSDDLYRADGSLIASVPVVGIIEFEGEKIVEWRDYCVDWMQEFLPETASA
jgi:limonene-1,2-epoxide hydrolase